MPAILGTSAAVLPFPLPTGASSPPPPAAATQAPPADYTAAPPGLMHPTAFLRRRPPMTMPPTSASSPTVSPPTIVMPPYIAAPPSLVHPNNAFFRRRPVDGTRAAASIPPPAVPQVYPPPYTGGPVPGPWSRRQVLPGQAVPALVPPPPPPPVIRPEVYPPTYHGGPVAGPWQGHQGPVLPTAIMPSPAPPGPHPNPPRQGDDPDLVPRVVGRDIDERLRRHTDKVADIINALLKRSNVVKVGAKDFAISPTHLDAGPPTVDDDLAAGYVRGSFWLDTTNRVAWINVDNATGSAVWLALVGVSGPTGLFTGSF